MQNIQQYSRETLIDPKNFSIPTLVLKLKTYVIRFGQRNIHVTGCLAEIYWKSLIPNTSQWLYHFLSDVDLRHKESIFSFEALLNLHLQVFTEFRKYLS